MACLFLAEFFFSEQLVKMEGHSLLACVLEWTRWVSSLLEKNFSRRNCHVGKLVPLQNCCAAAAFCGTGSWCDWDCSISAGYSDLTRLVMTQASVV